MFIQESLWDLKEDVGSSVNPLIQSLQGMEIDRRKQQGNSALTAKSIVLTQYLYRIAVYPLPWESHVEMNFEINTAKMLVKSVCISIWACVLMYLSLLIFTTVLTNWKNKSCFTLYKRNFPKSFVFIQIFMLEETEYAVLACSPRIEIVARNMQYDCRIHHTFEKVRVWYEVNQFWPTATLEQFLNVWISINISERWD